jgi:hypothetical protein
MRNTEKSLKVRYCSPKWSPKSAEIQFGRKSTPPTPPTPNDAPEVAATHRRIEGAINAVSVHRREVFGSR